MSETQILQRLKIVDSDIPEQQDCTYFRSFTWQILNLRLRKNYFGELRKLFKFKVFPGDQIIAHNSSTLYFHCGFGSFARIKYQ